VEGVIGTNKLHQLFAPGGSGKSFIALDMALCVAQYASVVYIAGEAIEDYHPRVDAWKQHHQKSASNLTFWNGPVDLGTPSAVQTFITAVQPLGPALIVLDPLASCMVGLEESSTGDMTRAIDALNTIRTATGAAVFVIHHTGWGTEHERGSSSLRAACRMVMKLTNDEGLLKLTCEKANSTQGFEPRYFRLLGRDGGTPVPVPASRVIDTSTKLSSRQLDVLEALSLQQFIDSGASHSSIVDHTSMSKSTANQAISKLLKQGLISANDGRFKVFKITPRGEEAVKNAAEQNTEAQQVEAAQGVNWQVNTSALEVHTPYELDMNYGMNYGELEPTGEGASSPEVHTPQAQVHTSSYQVHTPYEPKFISSYLPPSLEGEGVNNISEQHHMDSPTADNVLDLTPSSEPVRLVRNFQLYKAEAKLAAEQARASTEAAPVQPLSAKDTQRAGMVDHWIGEGEYDRAGGVISTIDDPRLKDKCLAKLEAETRYIMTA
jgi:DNA-binding MarR family transcriptional regulator